MDKILFFQMIFIGITSIMVKLLMKRKKTIQKIMHSREKVMSMQNNQCQKCENFFDINILINKNVEQQLKTKHRMKSLYFKDIQQQDPLFQIPKIINQRNLFQKFEKEFLKNLFKEMILSSFHQNNKLSLICPNNSFENSILHNKLIEMNQIYYYQSSYQQMNEILNYYKEMQQKLVTIDYTNQYYMILNCIRFGLLEWSAFLVAQMFKYNYQLDRNILDEFLILNLEIREDEGSQETQLVSEDDDNSHSVDQSILIFINEESLIKNETQCKMIKIISPNINTFDILNQDETQNSLQFNKIKKFWQTDSNQSKNFLNLQSNCYDPNQSNDKQMNY